VSHGKKKKGGFSSFPSAKGGFGLRERVEKDRLNRLWGGPIEKDKKKKKNLHTASKGASSKVPGVPLLWRGGQVSDPVGGKRRL